MSKIAELYARKGVFEEQMAKEEAHLTTREAFLRNQVLFSPDLARSEQVAVCLAGVKLQRELLAERQANQKAEIYRIETEIEQAKQTNKR